MQTLPTGSQERKDIPLAAGCLDYFPAALAAVAEVSKAGNDKHNPGEPLHHARGKSMDHADCIARHLLDRGTVDPEDGLRHSAKVAWRALALLQEELEAAGAPLARGAKLPEDGKHPDVGKVYTVTHESYWGVNAVRLGQKVRVIDVRIPEQDDLYIAGNEKVGSQFGSVSVLKQVSRRALKHPRHIVEYV